MKDAVFDTNRNYGAKSEDHRRLAASAPRVAAGLSRGVGLFLLIMLASLNAAEAKNALESMSFSTLPGEQVQIALGFTRPPSDPLAFTIDNPARIALDFADTNNRLNQRFQNIGVGVARSVNTAEANGRTRVVVNLAKLVGYQTEVNGNELIVTLGGRQGFTPNSMTAARSTKQQAKNSAAQSAGGAPSVTDIDFRRGPSGEGRVIVTLSDSTIPVDLREQGGKILLDIVDAQLPANLERRLDVLDFATPIKTIDTFMEDGKVRLVIEPIGDYEHLAYQADHVFTIEVREVPKFVQEKRKKEKFTGDRLSLNFQDIETRSVLSLIADFNNLNLVVSDSVGGNLTLRLKNVPWDQALDIILKTRGLAMRQTGNVMLIAPAEEIVAREKIELESQIQVQELAPLRTEFVQINYARAADIAALLKAPENSLLSDRGNVSIDTRTNTLLVQDTAERLAELRKLVKRLDVPVRQVLIESRIVIAQDNFSRELGVRFGVTNINLNSTTAGDTGSPNSDFVSGNLDAFVDANNGDPINLDDTLAVNLPVPDPAGSLGLALARLPLGYLVELELSAAQAESRVEIVSTPRVITSNQTQARIERGVEIPYQEASSSGATSVAFKKAVLSLEVTPQITPDDRIFMDLEVNNDNVGKVFNGIPSIDTRAIQTQVLVDNGQTVVLGGIYDTEKIDASNRVPFFSDIPLLGRLFRRDSTNQNKAELLIFITPKIISENLALVR